MTLIICLDVEVRHNISLMVSYMKSLLERKQEGAN